MAAARAIWKAVLVIGDEPPIPVKLYSAAQDRRVHFRLLHAADHTPVEQRMVTAGESEPVPPEEVATGFQVEPGVFVLLDEGELALLEPPPSRVVQLVRFVPRGAIASPWYHRPYWLGPDGDEGAYFALARALEETGREGVARWTMRRKSYVGALRGEQGRLLLSTLRREDEVLRLEDLELPRGRSLDERELGLAEQLLSALADHFDPAAFRDEYRERVLELIRSKAKGEAVELPRPKRKRAGRSLVKALEASLRKAKEAHVA